MRQVGWGSPRKEVMSPMGQQAHGKEGKWQEQEPNGLHGKRPLSGQLPIPRRDEKKSNASPKAQTCLTLQKTNITQYTWQKNTENNKNSIGMKEDKLRWSWHLHKAQRHHLLVPNQYMRGGPSVKGSKRCGLTIRRKKIYSGVPAETPFRKILYWDGIFPKRHKHRLGPLDAYHRGRYREPSALIC